MSSTSSDTDKFDIYDRFEAEQPPALGQGLFSAVASADPSNIQEVAASQLLLTNSYYRSVLRQSRQSFVAAVVAAGAGLVFFAAAVIVLLTADALNAALIGAFGGVVVEVISGLNFWLYSHAASQLGAFHLRLERTQHLLLANSVCEGLSASERDKARAGLVQQIVTVPVVPGQPNAVDTTAAEG